MLSVGILLGYEKCRSVEFFRSERAIWYGFGKRHYIKWVEVP